MKEQQLDEFVGKKVKVTDFEGDTRYGKLYKIVDSYVVGDKMHIPHAINNGYYLDRFYLTYGGGIDFRKSHIKKIELWDGKCRD